MGFVYNACERMYGMKRCVNTRHSVLRIDDAVICLQVCRNMHGLHVIHISAFKTTMQSQISDSRLLVLKSCGLSVDAEVK